MCSRMLQYNIIPLQELKLSTELLRNTGIQPTGEWVIVGKSKTTTFQELGHQ
jgi:hypothetical protein